MPGKYYELHAISIHSYKIKAPMHAHFHHDIFFPLFPMQCVDSCKRLWKSIRKSLHPKHFLLPYTLHNWSTICIRSHLSDVSSINHPHALSSSSFLSQHGSIMHSILIGYISLWASCIPFLIHPPQSNYCRRTIQQILWILVVILIRVDFIWKKQRRCFYIATQILNFGLCMVCNES